MSLIIDITQFIEEKLNTIQNSLREKGVSDEIIEQVFGASDDEPVAPMPKRRMLGSVDQSVPPESKQSIPIRANCTAQNSPNNLTQKWFGKPEVILVLNYTDKSHALFGDFAKTYLGFKNDYLKQQKWMIFNQSLCFGPGWVVRDKAMVVELRKALKSNKISFREVEKDIFVKELTKKAIEISDTSSDESKMTKKEVQVAETISSKTKKVEPKETKKVEPKETKKVEPKETKKVEPKETKKVEPVAPKIKKNQWGNFADDQSGLVFKKLPIGEKGKQVTIIIGYQNPSPGDDITGIESVLPLTSDHLEEAAEKHSYQTMTDEIIKTVKKLDKDLAEQLQNIQKRTLEDVDDEDISDIDDDDLEEDLDDEDLDDEDI